MQMRVNTLREALDLLKPVVPRKTTLPVLSNALLGEGRILATDLDVAVSIELEEADGKCLIPVAQVLEMLKRVPGDELLTIEQKKKELKLTWPGGSASYKTESPDDYPVTAKADGGQQKTVDGDTLVPALSSLVGYCSTDETRPTLAGVVLLLSEKLDVCASDGFRMAYRSLPIDLAIDGTETAIIPAQAVTHLARLWAKTPRSAPIGDSIVQIAISKQPVSLTFHEGSLTFRFSRVTLATKLIEGTPANMKKLIPTGDTPQVRFIASEFERAVRRVQQAAKGDNGIVRLAWTDKGLTVSAKSDEDGKVETTIPAEAEGTGKTTIGVEYLLEYIKGKEGLITMDVQNPESPVVFHHGSSPLVVIMPRLVK